MVTVEQLQKVKNEALEKRDMIIKAEATMGEVKSSIAEKEKALKDLGVNPETADEDIKKMEEKIDDIYKDIKDKLEKIPL